MKVSVIGTGYVGLVSGTCFAEMGHEVTCIDVDHNKIEMLNKGIPTIYEAGLQDLLHRNIKANRLFFSTGYSSVTEAKVIFLAVGTPPSATGEANLEFLFAAVKDILSLISENCLLVIKSTVPVGTSKKVKDLVRGPKVVHVVNNPEFLKEGSAVDDFMRPDRVVIGHELDYAAEVMEELYAPLVRQGNPIYRMSNLSAEMTKYAANCFLATKISFINEIARLCDATGADIEEVRKGMTSDKRIGPHFLYPGPGYGGSCFPKDVLALIAIAKDNDQKMQVIEAVEKVNQEQKLILFRKMMKYFNNDLNKRKIAFWGVSFKPNTDDVRESSALAMAKAITKEGALVHYFDPVAAKNFESMASNEGIDTQKLIVFNDKYECLEDCDALCVVTDWSEFKSPDFEILKKYLKTPVIFDGRNLFNTKKVLQSGLDYFAIGKFIPRN